MFSEGLRKNTVVLWKSVATKVVKQAQLEAAHNKRILTLLKDICIENLEGIPVYSDSHASSHECKS